MKSHLAKLIYDGFLMSVMAPALNQVQYLMIHFHYLIFNGYKYNDFFQIFITLLVFENKI